MAPEHKKRAGELPQNLNERHPPFDTTDLEKLLAPRADDPPYRSWWVVGEQTQGR
jgi:hypothetical protein